MKKLNVVIEGIGNVSLTDSNYIGSGGEANVYKVNSQAVKLYHDPKKSIPRQKITELGSITSPDVLKPLHVVYDEHGSLIGYSMDFIKGAEPICKMFTKSFKSAHGISFNHVTDLVKAIRNNLDDIHSAKCLVVDLNEMNIVIGGSSFDHPYMIDVDSYQTPSFKATAIMDSIRDRLVRNNQWSELSDWYSYAILCFQLYIGIHPYKGTHPKYKPNEWLRRMDEGVSVFDKNVSLPAVCNDMRVIPPRYLDWMKMLFVDNRRDVPPDIDRSIPIPVTVTTVFVKGDDKFTYTLVETLPEDVVSATCMFGVVYYVTTAGIYRGSSKIVGLHPATPAIIARTGTMRMIYGLQYRSAIDIMDDKGSFIGKLMCDQSNVMNGDIYVSMGSRLLRVNVVETASGKSLCSFVPVANIMEMSSKFFDGVIYQDMLGTPWATFPMEGGMHTVRLPEIAGHRVLDMKKVGNLLVAMVELNGTYSKMMFLFSRKHVYSFRKVDNVSYADLAFTCLDNGVNVMVNDGGSVDIFKDFSKIKTVDGTSFDTATPIVSIGGKVHVLDRNKVYVATAK